MNGEVPGNVGHLLNFKEGVKLLDTMSALVLLCYTHPSHKVTRIDMIRMCDLHSF